MVDAAIAHRHGDVERATAALEAMESTASDNGAIEALAGEALIYQEQYESGIALLQRWIEWAMTASGVLASNLAFGLTFHAYGLHGQGKLDEAERTAERAIEALQEIGLSELPVYAVGALPAGWVAWERGDHTAAATMAEVVTPVIEAYGEIPAAVLAKILLARVRFSSSDPEAALAVLHDARIMRSGRPVVGHFGERITFEEVRMHLLLGDPAAARLALPDWRERLERGPRGMREQLLLARLLIDSGEDATALLEELPAGAEVTVVHEMELLKLRALVALRAGDEAGALERLTAAMRIAVHSGHRQLFLDDERALGALLDNAAAASGFLLRFDRDAAPVAPVADAQARLIEPLSERELELLRLLPSHLSYREIGERMYLSTNTVKSYVKSVYRKLDADRRTEAVEHARAIGLVP
ncbi:MAG: LuxR C-terminal-related transcriptional regulator [Chloroflexota bacterium]|jgi:LuxR family maltose regulon positive regulatory protein